MMTQILIERPTQLREWPRPHALPAAPADSRPATDGELRSVEVGPIDLELGGHLPAVTVAYRTWGQLNAARDNVVLALHALTGDSRAGGDGGWWEPLIGPGRALDTDRAFVLCANILGGNQGTTGPASLDPLTGRPYAMRFPLITIGDMVAVQRRLVDQFGITKLIAIGGSIGGFQALEWATRHADLVGGTVAIAASARLGAQGIALHGEIGRRAIMADPNWRGGRYADYGVAPETGLAIARMAAMVTYQSRESMEARFGRRPATRPTRFQVFGGTFEVENYLHHHGDALVKRFDANSYLYLSRAMDLYDLGRDGGDETWLRKIVSPLLLTGIRSDWLFPSFEIRQLAMKAASYGADVSYREIDSPHGHDAFLKEWDQLTAIVTPFLDRTLPAPATVRSLA